MGYQSLCQREFPCGYECFGGISCKGNEEWTELDASAITKTGNTSYSAELTGLQSGTDYEVRALAGGSEGEAYSFQTETIVTLPNMNFDTWTQSGKLGIRIL